LLSRCEKPAGEIEGLELGETVGLNVGPSVGRKSSLPPRGGGGRPHGGRTYTLRCRGCPRGHAELLATDRAVFGGRRQARPPARRLPPHIVAAVEQRMAPNTVVWTHATRGRGGTCFAHFTHTPVGGPSGPPPPPHRGHVTAKRERVGCCGCCIVRDGGDGVGDRFRLADGGHRRFPSRPSFCGILVPPPPLGTHPRRDTRPAAGTARAFSTTTAIREPRWMRHYNNGYLYSAKREFTA
jgi:hypothetical protein